MTSQLAHRTGVSVPAVAAMGLALLISVGTHADEPDGADGFIQRVLAQTTRSGFSVRGTREMRAGTVSGKHQGWMTVETKVTPAGVFSWTVVSEGGSNRTRERVFRAVLDTEADTWRDGARDRAALALVNYEFTRLPATGAGEVQIRLTPRRVDSRLIDGILTVSSDGYPLRLEGKLAKSPSFWVKSVHVVKRYGRFAGVALPTVIESRAELKLFGRSTFTMRYQYQEVNGRILSAAAATAESSW